ncbi:type II toxin-antitoxin system RelE/ParE family toxin [uncultured Maricaulis sp.]|uniref:type II toxin-antitoxin system RelE/ParE family toxin n=1 Tax=uncultured Maricaulis sp. TaxID=174710 RepID=UPI0030DCC081
MKVEFAPLAQVDLREIAGFIALDNPARADSFIDEIIDRCLALADFPEAAPQRDDIDPGIRALSYKQYLILYRVREAMVRIERVQHGNRKLQLTV